MSEDKPDYGEHSEQEQDEANTLTMAKLRQTLSQFPRRPKFYLMSHEEAEKMAQELLALRQQNAVMAAEHKALRKELALLRESVAAYDGMQEEANSLKDKLVAAQTWEATARQALKDARHELTTLHGLVATDQWHAYNQALQDGADHDGAWDALNDVAWKIDETAVLQTLDSMLSTAASAYAARVEKLEAVVKAAKEYVDAPHPFSVERVWSKEEDCNKQANALIRLVNAVADLKEPPIA